MKKVSCDYYIIMKIMERHNISKRSAEKLYRNALIYKKVVNEILLQTDYLVINNIELI